MTEDVRITGGWNPRLSPSGQHCLSTWIGEPDAQGVRPTASIVNRQVICAGGYGGDWLNETTVVITDNNNGGRLLLWSVGDAEPKPLHGPIAIGGNVIAAANGMLAISRTDPPRTLIAAGDVTELPGFVQPALSDSGEDYAYLRQADSTLSHHGFIVDERACFNPQFGGETLAYECDSRIYGFTTLGQPRIDLTIPGLPQHRPIPVWTGRDLVVLSHTNTGVILQQWGSPRGWTVYQGITGGPHHARALDATHVRCVWSVRGELQETVIDLDSASIDLTPHDDEWTDTAPIDLLPLIVGDESRWPRHGSHDLHQTWDGRILDLVKFSGPDNWERWELVGDQFYLREDRSQSGAGDYSFHPGTWFGRHMALGQWITVPDNQIQRYEPKSCAVQSVSRFPYRVGLVRAWRRLDCGGDIGIVERTSKPAAVLLAYDPGGLHDTIEYYLFVDGWGLAKWRVQNQDDPSTYHETVFTFLGGTRVTPTQGCYKALHPPEKPVSLTVQQVHEAFRALPWDVDVAHLARFRDNVWKRDQGGDVPSRGALAYYHREVFAAIVERFDAMGRLPAGPPEQVFAEWDQAFALGTQRAIARYRAEQAPDPEDHPNPQ
jgi:hypothetical protein